MAKDQLTVDQARDMLLHVAQTMIDSKDTLTHADQAIGDGDHGVSMARGFEEVERRLHAGSFASTGDLCRAVGTALMSSIGGASGAVFGTLFRGGARSLTEADHFGATELAQLLSDGLQAVKDRGKAMPGDKTMVDALEPAAARAREVAGLPLHEALAEVAAAARAGMESTRDMIATTGKAKTLGERSLGHIDPGALSTYLMINAMAEYALG